MVVYEVVLGAFVMCDCLLHEAVPENEGLFILDMCRRNHNSICTS